MRIKNSLIKNRKGQVFLLLAIVIMIYLILLSTTVFRITQSPFVELAPNQNQIMNYIDNSVSSIYDLAYAGIAQFSQGTSMSEVNDSIISGLATIEAYLDNHNIPSLIRHKNDIVISQNSATSSDVYIQIYCEISILVDSLEIYFSADYTVNVSFHLERSSIVGTENDLYLYKIQNGLKTMINDATVSIIPFTSASKQGDGSFQLDLELGQEITAIFPHNVILTMEI